MKRADRAVAARETPVVRWKKEHLNEEVCPMLRARRMPHGPIGWRTLVLGVGLSLGLVALVRRLMRTTGWGPRWMGQPEGARRWRYEDEGTPSRPPEDRAPVTHVPVTVEPFQSSHVPAHTETPLPELPQNTGQEVRSMDSESIHNEQMRPQVSSDPSTPADIRPLDPNNDDDIRRIAIEKLRENPHASLDDVLSAWHVQRGVEIDAEEERRVASIYTRLSETGFEAA